MITTLNTWVQQVSPGFTSDFFTLTGWLCAELFVDALRKAGTDRAGERSCRHCGRSPPSKVEISFR